MPTRHPSDRPSPYSVLIATIFAILLLLFVHSVADVLLMVFVAALFSLYLGGIADFLQARTNMPRGLGLACAPVLTQTQDVISALPKQITTWTASLRELVARYPVLQQVIHPDEVQRQLGGLATHASGVVPAVLNFLQGFIDLSAIVVMG